MSTNLLEQYKKRLDIAESVYSKAHEGEAMDNHKKLLVAQLIKNTQSFLSEALGSANGTQRADLGLYKKFCVNLVNVAVPNLVATDLVLTKPMTSMSGYIAYLKYETATNKGKTAANTVFNDPFRLGAVDSEFTGQAVTESLTAGTGNTIVWGPVVKGTFENAGTAYDAKVVASAGTETFVYINPADKKLYTSFTAPSTYASEYSATAGDKVAYKYDNVVVPQNDIPRIKAVMDNIPLIAKARRIAIYYSQIAAFQAKTDYGFDLGDQLAEQAVGRLNYEIDTEVIELLDKTADANTKSIPAWSKTLPVGVNKRDHYAGFAEVIEIGKQLIYDATQRFVPNYMICASNILPVLQFIDGFKPASTANINGPYIAGTFGPLKVVVSPALAAGKYLIGVNGSDYMSSVAVYAPYLPVVPTQLLQFDDGATSQGFSTMYDLRVLNSDLIVAGSVTA